MRCRKDYLNEVRVLELLEHPNIVQYHTAFISESDTSEEDFLVIVMEFCENGDLSQWLQTKQREDITEDVALNIFIQVIKADLMSCITYVSDLYSSVFLDCTSIASHA